MCQVLLDFTVYLPLRSIEELQELFTVVKGDITARTVARTLGMMIAPNTAGEMVS